MAMADGFSQTVGHPVLVNLHATAGVGNALGNLFTAYRNRTPLVVLAGQQPRSLLVGRPYLAGETPATFPQPYVKWSVEPHRAADVPELLAQAIRIAAQPPSGPTFISVPADDWDAVAAPVRTRSIESGFVASAAVLRGVAAALDEAVSPLLVTGAGVDREGAWPDMIALAQRLRAPVWGSPLAGRASFPEDHPLYQGSLPPIRQRIAEILDGHDTVVVVGAPLFTYHLPSDGELQPAGQRLFHLTEDPHEAAAAQAGMSILTTLKPALRALTGMVASTTRPLPAPRGPHPVPGPSDPLTGDYVLHALARVLPDRAIVVEEAPSHRPALQRHVPITRSGGYYTTASGGMGFGLPAAVGVALAGAGDRVVAVLGDGAAEFSIQALWTAARFALPITFIVLNNGGYGALDMLGRSRYGADLPGVHLPGIDLTAVASGYGCAAGRVTRAADLPAALEQAVQAPGPFLLDVTVAPPAGLLY